MVVIPCYNEERQVPTVLAGIPAFVSHVCVVDDASTDGTVQRVMERAREDPRVHLVRHDANQGVGGAIASGYAWARDQGADVAVVMDGDGQMDPADLPALLRPILVEGVDCAKGNRLLHQASDRIPRVRFLGNSVLSLLTKVASGYWHIADSQSGYVAIGARVLRRIDWSRMYRRYGQPNDLLIMLNALDMRVRGVEVAPLYDVGERSRLRPHRVALPIFLLLVRGFLWRLKEKYVIRDFHPLVFFYGVAVVSSIVAVAFGIRLVVLWSRQGTAPELTAMALLFSVGYALQASFFAMWMDMEQNKNLR